jgi:hypothetical protein
VPRRVLAALLLGLAVRLVALPLPGMVDVKAWKAWAVTAANVGLAPIYGPPDRELWRRGQGDWAALATQPPRAQHWYKGELFFVDYPPGSLILLWIVGRGYLALDPAQLNGRLLNALLGLLPLAGSIVLAWLLARSAPGPLGWSRALAFWCNPAVWLAAVLGYQDPLMAAAAVAALHALGAGRPVLAAALTALAGMLKPQAALLLPTLAVVVLGETRPRTWLRAGLAGLALAALVLAPWWSQGYLLSALNAFRGPLWAEPGLSSQAMNLGWIAGYLTQWQAEGPWPLARIVFLDAFATAAGFDARHVSRALLALGTLANVVLLRAWPRQDPARIPMSAVLQTHIYALCGTGVHENHTLLAVMAAPLVLGSWPRARALVAMLSAFAFANLFLFEGLGRGIVRDRVLWRLRLALGLDLTVLGAVLHVLLVLALFKACRERAREEARPVEASAAAAPEAPRS